MQRSAWLARAKCLGTVLISASPLAWNRSGFDLNPQTFLRKLRGKRANTTSIFFRLLACHSVSRGRLEDADWNVEFKNNSRCQWQFTKLLLFFASARRAGRAYTVARFGTCAPIYVPKQIDCKMCMVGKLFFFLILEWERERQGKWKWGWQSRETSSEMNPLEGPLWIKDTGC